MQNSYSNMINSLEASREDIQGSVVSPSQHHGMQQPGPSERLSSLGLLTLSTAGGASPSPSPMNRSINAQGPIARHAERIAGLSQAEQPQPHHLGGVNLAPNTSINNLGLGNNNDDEDTKIHIPPFLPQEQCHHYHYQQHQQQGQQGQQGNVLSSEEEDDLLLVIDKKSTKEDLFRTQAPSSSQEQHRNSVTQNTYN